MRHIESIRTRLTLASVLTVGAFGVVLGVGCYSWAAENQRQGLERFALHEAAETAAVIAEASDVEGIEARSKSLNGLFPENGVVSIEIWTLAGELVVAMPSDGPILGEWREGLAAARAGEAPFRDVGARSFPSALQTAALVSYSRKPRWLVTAAVRTDQATDSLQRFVAAYVVGFVFLLGLTAVAARSLVSKALRPMRTVVNEAIACVKSPDATVRVANPPAQSELRGLVGLINELLDRTGATVERLRVFTANAGHELRSPLARIRGEIEQVLNSDSTDAESTLRTVLEEIDTQRRVIDALLELAHSSDRLLLEREPLLDLSELAHELAEQAQALGHAKGLRVEVKSDPDECFGVRGNRALLARALWNLLDNAVKYSPPLGAIEISVSVFEGSVCLDVLSELAEGDLPLEEAHFAPFARGLGTGHETDGHGLGLALTRAIASRHHGTVCATHASSPGKTGVRLMLPRAKSERQRPFATSTDSIETPPR